MEKRPESINAYKRIIDKEFQEKFLRDVLPVLKENERWRNRSRRADFTTCPPGGCPVQEIGRSQSTIWTSLTSKL